MQKYGLIGRYLGHSFSAEYFREKIAREGADAVYVPLEIATIDALPKDWDGYSVTIPYKEAILPYLTELDDTARAIGAVNVVKGHKGYNTDWIGFSDSIRPLLQDSDRHALVLGTGGAAKAILYALQQMGLTAETVSRTHGLRYEDLRAEDMNRWQVIVNCTPVGMWPATDECPDIPYAGIGREHLLFDCIYNPEETLFLCYGRERGARTKNGMEMLLRQADEAWKIWNNE
jgi:shikimate dehydrogenase